MFDVLQSHEQITQSRKVLQQRGVSSVDPAIIRRLRNHKLLRGVNVGHNIKSWDVLRTLDFIRGSVATNAAILDIGAYASEILCSLHKSGYTNLHGVDLNPGISAMPFRQRVTYKVSDFMHAPYPDAMFDVITATSVIEHGYQGERLFGEVSRLLKDEGFFVASFDYWPEKLNTDGINLFGMSWTIFSNEDVQNMAKLANLHHMTPHLKIQSIVPKVGVIDTMARKYTFAWIVFKKIAC